MKRKVVKKYEKQNAKRIKAILKDIRRVNKKTKFWYWRLEGEAPIRISYKEWKKNCQGDPLLSAKVGDRELYIYFRNSTAKGERPNFTIVDYQKVDIAHTFQEALATFERFKIEAKESEDRFYVIRDRYGELGIHYVANYNLDQTGIAWEAMDFEVRRWLYDHAPNFMLIHDATYGAFLVLETIEQVQAFKDRWMVEFLKHRGEMEATKHAPCA